MQINLANPGELTLESVSELIASVEDDQNWQLRVNTLGIAYLSSDTGNHNLSGVLFRLETWGMGNDYVGINAARDKDWVRNVFNSLNQNWPIPQSSYIDF